MLRFNDYDLIIFDCDGVLIDSNDLKIEAMGNALAALNVTGAELSECKKFFSENFGKSRFYHVDFFIDKILGLEQSEEVSFKEKLLSAYSKQCKELYLTANLTPFIESLLKTSTAIKYVASGSEQGELREVFKQRDLDNYFSDILGSPEKKHNHVSDILNKHKKLTAVMIGDAVSDLEAAKNNHIDFIFYSPFSNVADKMRDLCIQNQYRILDSFEEVIE